MRFGNLGVFQSRGPIISDFSPSATRVTGELQIADVRRVTYEFVPEKQRPLVSACTAWSTIDSGIGNAKIVPINPVLRTANQLFRKAELADLPAQTGNKCGMPQGVSIEPRRLQKSPNCN
jgi:hypothetical protein